MFDDVLFPTDGSDPANESLEYVLEFVDAYDGTLHVLNVADTNQPSLVRVETDVIDVLEREGSEIVEKAAGQARDRGLEATSAVLQGDPHRTIIEYADDLEIDLIVMPTHGRGGVERLLLGSTTERVIRSANVPVLTRRPGTAMSLPPFDTVLVPTDGSECARRALDQGIDIAHADGSVLHLLSVIDVASLGVDVRSDVQLDLWEDSAESILDQARAVVRDRDLESIRTAISYGSSVSREIERYTDDEAIDVVVMGTHGRTGLDRFMMGSVTARVVRSSSVPVVAVR